MTGTGLTVATGQKVALEGQVTGTDPVHLSVRASVSGGSTPDWQKTYDDSSSSKIVDSGESCCGVICLRLPARR